MTILALALRRSLYWCAAAALFALAVPAVASAQGRSQRGQPKTPFGTADFAKLRWLEGSWVATAPGDPTMYERIHFLDDSTAEISYYRDASMSQPRETGRLYLTAGRVYHTFGPGRWGATHVDTDGLFFVPQANATNTFKWEYKSPDEWNLTLRSGVGGHNRVTVWDLKRVH